MGRKGKKKVGKSVIKIKEKQKQMLEDEYSKVPHAFVIHRGVVGKYVKELMDDTRRIMEPFCARNLRARRKNTLKDFISMAGPLNITNILSFTKTENGMYLKVMRLPRGPTLTFKIQEYTLSRDIVSSLKRHYSDPKQFDHHPLLVMNNFTGEGLHLKLMSTMFQNMFPSININKVKLADIKRTLLLQYDPETKNIDLRHYNVRAVPVGMSRGVKKLIKSKLPDLGAYEDVSEFILRGNLSESEVELDGPHNEIVLPQNMPGKGNKRASQSAIRLTEIGPRMTLHLIKVEEGICDGKVIFHDFIAKTPEEIQLQQKIKEEKKKLKDKRKQIQKENVKKKELEKEMIKEKALAGMKRKAEQDGEEKDEDNTEDNTGNNTKIADDDDADDDDADDENNAEEEDDDDVEYYRQEVGEEPDEDIVRGLKRKQTPRKPSLHRNKKLKMEMSNKGVPRRGKSLNGRGGQRGEMRGKSSNRGTRVQAGVRTKGPGTGTRGGRGGGMRGGRGDGMRGRGGGMRGRGGTRGRGGGTRGRGGSRRR
ncbi:suppressor of SWI4 1 homolog [Tubulanus polymorphus]|uniref:suppressor of SWI4 1 homolog n=1 Tax=Tubulanus polymorphus TaxID=672921 RepID=UPI003DA49870